MCGRQGCSSCLCEREVGLEVCTACNIHGMNPFQRAWPHVPVGSSISRQQASAAAALTCGRMSSRATAPRHAGM